MTKIKSVMLNTGQNCTFNPKFAQALKDLGLVSTYLLSLNLGCSKLRRFMLSSSLTAIMQDMSSKGGAGR